MLFICLFELNKMVQFSLKGLLYKFYIANSGVVGVYYYIFTRYLFAPEIQRIYFIFQSNFVRYVTGLHRAISRVPTSSAGWQSPTKFLYILTSHTFQTNPFEYSVR